MSIDNSENINCSAEELRSQIDMDRLPAHIAFIMDGNRRWAKKHFRPSIMGHKAGVSAFRTVMETCRALGIKALSAYAFSAENWQRAPGEVSLLMQLFEYYAKAERRKMLENGIRFKVIGDMSVLADSVREELILSEKATAECSDMTLNLAINYGSRNEILRAVQLLASKAAAGEIKPESISEADISASLYTDGTPDPDLLVRTSGELRLSNFLLWQCAYTEFYFSDTLWPDVDEAFVYRAVLDYQHRMRRYGS